MRLFIALDIDDAIRTRLSRFVEGVTGFAPDARWVKPESLHVTLKFIGEQPDPAVDQIKQALSQVESSGSEIHFRGYGFFPTAKSARVFWIGMEADPRTRNSGRHNRRQNGLPRNPQRRPSLQSAPDPRARRRRIRLTPPQHNRPPQPCLPPSPGKTVRASRSRIRYHDGARVLSIPKPTLPERIKIHKAGKF